MKRFLSRQTRNRVQAISGQPTYLKQLVASGYAVNRKPEKRHYTTAEVLAGEPARRGRDTTQLVWDKWDAILEATCGNDLLRVRKGRHSVVKGRAVYAARCACGNRVRLTAQEVVKRNTTRVGCCSPNCAAASIEQHVWYGPIAALQLQVGQLITLHPEAVDRQWAGLSLAEIAVALRWEQLKRSPQPYGNWWLKDVKKHGLKDVKNIQFDTFPDRWVIPATGVVVKWGDEVFPLDEVAEAYGVDMQKAMHLRMSYFDKTVIDKMIGE